MPNLRLPLSGDVMQTINPWNWFFKSTGSQFGLVNINLGRSADPALEEDILNEVGRLRPPARADRRRAECARQAHQARRPQRRRQEEDLGP